jgi:sugar/nucleoside kinase (ribokinase family)
VLVCIGDLTLDVVVRLAGALAPDGDTDADIKLGPGGQAANVAAWASTLGAQARFVGKTGADDVGALVRARLGAYGVDVVGPIDGRNGVICALVSSDGSRSMAADRGAARELRADELDTQWFAGCDDLYISGYALMAEPVREAALRATELARAEGARVGVDLGSWSAIRDAGVEAFSDTVRVIRPDVVFANEDEERVVGHVLDAAWIVTRGGRGCSFDGEERAALPVEGVVDTTGAGDALAAGWLVDGPELALEAAARCIGHLGGMPVASPV